MIIVAALTFGVVTGSGVYLLLSRDLVKLIAGTLLLSNGAVVFLISSDFRAQRAPIHPISGNPSDPLVQALALTAIVIGFATTVYFLRVGVMIERTHATIEMEDLARAEEEDEPEPGEGGSE